ncbi:hypothetical protein [Phytoactinopolyspora endophytica]|uniref:hypothetical protein n=1 Tax=Phytoactinopolyspora endophytica TaxID=1642495 RepID=UPI00101DA930|nr:hypothetical protein [Phytoactinopolyspora endophytica]
MGTGSAPECRDAVAAAVTTLESAVSRLRQAYGDTLGVRRLTSDVARLSEDLEELGEPHPGRRSHIDGPLEAIPDTPYDPSMWAGAEDEGLGAPDRHAP